VVRIHYVLAGAVDRERGPLQLHFEDGRDLLLRVASDGESLRVERAP
jgi:hypothetical protein